MNCLVCRGACCEFLVLAIGTPTPRVFEFAEARRLPILRVVGPLALVEIDHRCPELTAEGRCAIYHEDRRPEVCIEAQPGGTACLQALRRQRTPPEIEAIREPGDPEVV